MKKLIVFALVLAMALAVPTAVLADTFVSSPSNQSAPTLGDVTGTPENWGGEIIITSYGDRHTLSQEAQEQMESAYEDIKEAKTVTDLTEDLKDVIEGADLTPEDVAVGSMFDVSASEEGADSATLTMTSEQFENFVALLYYDGEEWHVVDGAKVDGKTLTFKTMGYGTYAVVVATEKDAPPTGEALPMGIIALAVLFGVAGVCFFVKSKANA